MDAKTIADVKEFLLIKPAKVKRDSKISDAVQALMDNPSSKKVYVVDEEDKVLGTISHYVILRAASARFQIRKEGFFPFVRYLKDMFMDDVHTLMKKTEVVNENTLLSEALELMLKSKETDLPVVDDGERLKGELQGIAIMHLGIDVIKRGDDLTEERLKKIREERENKLLRASPDPVTLKPRDV